MHSTRLRTHVPAACHRALLDAGEAILPRMVVFACSNAAYTSALLLCHALSTMLRERRGI